MAVRSIFVEYSCRIVSVFCPSLPLPLIPLFPLLTQCDGCPDDQVWGLMAGLRGLPAMGAYYCLGAGWSQWRPLGLPGHPSSTQLNAVVKVQNQHLQEIYLLKLHESSWSLCQYFVSFSGYKKWKKSNECIF